MNDLIFSILGFVSADVTVTEIPGGAVRIEVVNSGEGVADLRGLFFHVNDPSVLPSLQVDGSEVTAVKVASDGVSNLGSGVNMNGVGAFDVGVSFGTSGIGKDDIRSTVFTVTAGRPLTVRDFAGARFGVRYTSVGTEGGAREDSLKLARDAPNPGYDVGNPPPDGGEEF